MTRKLRRLRLEPLEKRFLLAADITLLRHFELWNGGVIRSTDGAGIAYHPPSGHLYLSDSEINETPEFEGNNIFEVSLLGDQVFREIQSNNTEPTGITYNEYDGFFYVTNDLTRKVTRYDSNLNNPLASTDTRDAIAEADDPEGIASNPTNGDLYVIDGVGGSMRVLTYDSNLNFLSSFSVAGELSEAEGIAYHPTKNHLFVVSDPDNKIVEYTLAGGFVDEYDISGFSPAPRSPQGLTVAPTSDPNDDSSNLALYIVDGMSDNTPDGRVYEATIDPFLFGSCLDGSSNIVTVTGQQTSRYDESGLADGTGINAIGATWYALDDSQVTLENSSDLCFRDGLIEHNFPEEAAWDVTHQAHAIRLFNTPNATVEGSQLVNSGDGISIYAGSSNFTIRGVYLEDMRDDCIESDYLEGGLIEDTLLESCYVTFAARARSGDIIDGSHNTWVIKDTLARLRPQLGVFKGASPGHGGFFKWDPLGPQLEIHNSIFRADQLPNHNDLGIPDGKLTSCSNNTMVWLGAGDYPEPLPECFTVTTDVSVWDDAVQNWKTNHGIPTGVIVGDLTGDTNEDGGAATFSVVLDKQPTASVTIPVSSSDSSEGTVDTASLVFDAINWTTPQTVTVTGVDDLTIDGDIDYTVVLSPATSADPYYDGFDPVDVSVTNRDNDAPQIEYYFPLSGMLANGGTNYVSGQEPTADTFNSIDLQSTDGIAQQVTEGESLGGGKKLKYSSALDYYRWSFGAVQDATAFHLNAWRDANAEGDDFTFQYSLDNGNTWTTLAVVNSESAQAFDVDFSATPISGAVLVRVTDTNRSPVNGSRTPSLESVFVDALHFQSLSTDLRPSVTVTATDDRADESSLDPGQFTITREGTSGDLQVFYTMGGSAIEGTDFVSLGSAVTIPDGQAAVTISLVPIDDNEAEGSESVVLTLDGDDSYGYKVGASDSATATILDDDLQSFTANSESTIFGTVISNSYTATADADGVVETIQEFRTGGKPSSRTTYVDHRWEFSNVNGARSFYLTASRPNNSENDDFVFEYSTDGGSRWTSMATVNSPEMTLYPVDLPAVLSGTILVRVIDTDPSTSGHSVADTVSVDQMYFSATPLAPFVLGKSMTVDNPKLLHPEDLWDTAAAALDHWHLRELHSETEIGEPRFELTQIAQGYLGLAFPNQNRIQIDIDAGGLGWQHVDLFTTLVHEIGHLYGHNHDVLGESFDPEHHLDLGAPHADLDSALRLLGAHGLRTHIRNQLVDDLLTFTTKNRLLKLCLTANGSEQGVDLFMVQSAYFPLLDRTVGLRVLDELFADPSGVVEEEDLMSLGLAIPLPNSVVQERQAKLCLTRQSL